MERENYLNKSPHLHSKASRKTAPFGLEFEEAAFMNKMIALFGFFFGILIFTFVSTHTVAQTTDEITKSIESGSSKSLGKFLNETVTLNINNNLSDYSKNQAELVFRDFFRKHPPKDFEVLHRDEPTDKTWHFIGKYYSDEADFRVLVKGTKQNGALSISTMEFTRE